LILKGILKLLFEQQNPSFVTLTIGSNHYTPLQAARILMQTEKVGKNLIE